ncbi:MAG TPA: GNAT family N-acetyltransferase [Candidatus Nanopelagicales bacterium]|nr:GNAT family N-acetyltransferase [Candidatus Nanopelagicales bacterium]
MDLRPLRYVDGSVHPDDLAAATRLALESEAAFLGEPESTPDDVGYMLGVPSVDRSASGFLDQGGEPVGLLVIDDDPFEHVTGIESFSLPWPGSSDVRADLVRRGLDVARRRREETGVPAWKARAGGVVADTAYSDVLTAAGFEPVRRFYRMAIDATSPEIPSTAPVLPDGVEIVVRDDDATRRAVYDVDRAAFSEHWGFADYPYDEWISHMTSSPSYDPSHWWLLTVDGVPAGICLLGDRRLSKGEGYINVLGVLKDYRGRGLAQLLLRRAFVHYRDLGRTAIALGVDATNTTGAVALYEKVGMRPALVMEAYEHDLS